MLHAAAVAAFAELVAYHAADAMVGPCVCGIVAPVIPIADWDGDVLVCRACFVARSWDPDCPIPVDGGAA